MTGVQTCALPISDWGYGTLEKHFGEGFARAIVDGAAAAGVAASGQIGEIDSLKSIGQSMGNAVSGGIFNDRMQKDIQNRIRIFTTWTAEEIVDVLIYEMESAWLGSDGGGQVLDAIFGPQLSDQIFWGLRYWGDKIRPALDDIKDSFDEVGAAFAGGDWGYGTLEKHFGEGISRAIVGGAASAGNALRGWQTQTGGDLQAAGRAMGNTVGDAMAQGITRDKRPFIQREIGELLHEIGRAHV